MICCASWLTLFSVVSGACDSGFHVQPYLQRPEPDAITVMWETTKPATGEVRYGPTPEAARRVVESERRGVHEVRLTGLLPRTRYFYRVRCGDDWSDLRSFRTPPGPDGERWRLVVYGDSRSYPDRHERVAELAAEFDPDLVLHTGDLVARGSQRPLWKSQFFDPAANLFARVPVVTSLGNHEEAADNYFEYLSLPSNERYFSLDFGNAHIVVLDSTGWGNSARDSDQYQWLREDLAQKRPMGWTLVAFHHPLFSAHEKRPIHRARWDWWPLFEELGVDVVLTGHDHFYYRSWPIGRLGETPARGIRNITTGGGGASLYRVKERSYTAAQSSVHHLTVLDFTGDTIHGRAVDTDGTVIDEFTFTKQPTPPEEFCAFEVYELELAIRRAIEQRPVTVVPNDGTEALIDEELQVLHTFRVPVSGQLSWVRAEAAANGARTPVTLEPGKPVSIPLQLRLDRGASTELPRMRLELTDQRFRNRQIMFSPLKLGRDIRVQVSDAPGPQTVADVLQNPGKPDGYRVHELVRSTDGGLPAVVAKALFARSGGKLLVAVGVHDAGATIEVGQSSGADRDSKSLVKEHHVRVLVATADKLYSFLVTPRNERAAARNQKWDFDPAGWAASSRREGEYWVAEVAIPLKLLRPRDGLRINVVHFDPAAATEDCLSPTFDAGNDPDRIPDFRFDDRSVQRFARLTFE